MKGKYRIKKIAKCDHQFMLIETDKNFIWKCKKCGLIINKVAVETVKEKM